MSETKYYDGTKLLSMKDLNGDKPEIYICTSNRTAGKTTYFARMLMNRFLKKGEKFCLVYRFDYELGGVDGKFFKDIGELFFQEYIMRAQPRAKGKYSELYLCDKFNEEDPGVNCGYAVTLNSADVIKRYSHMFSDVGSMWLDEFQSDTNKYCDSEIEKLISIHTSIARGQGEQVRYVPVYLTGNPVTLLNPYYVELGIAERLKTDTKFLKGVGFVLEQGYNKSAEQAQKESGFNRAFYQNKYIGFSAEGVYLNDSTAFIEKPVGVSRYICTLKYHGKEYALREYQEHGFIYCDNKPDTSFPTKLAVTTSDHNVNYVMLKANRRLLEVMRYFFNKGAFRFKNLQCKEVVLKALSY